MDHKRDQSPDGLQASSYREEYAAEVASPNTRMLNLPEEDRPEASRTIRKRGDQAGQHNKTMGWVGLSLAIASLFVFPGLFGSAAVAIGFLSYTNGPRTLGAWSIIIGLVSIIGWFLVNYIPV